jgi:hypothetical protein
MHTPDPKFLPANLSDSSDHFLTDHCESSKTTISVHAIFVTLSMRNILFLCTVVHFDIRDGIIVRRLTHEHAAPQIVEQARDGCSVTRTTREALTPNTGTLRTGRTELRGCNS